MISMDFDVEGLGADSIGFQSIPMESVLPSCDILANSYAICWGAIRVGGLVRGFPWISVSGDLRRIPSGTNEFQRSRSIALANSFRIFPYISMVGTWLLIPWGSKEFRWSRSPHLVPTLANSCAICLGCRGG